jgi:hypothetical protein
MSIKPQRKKRIKVFVLSTTVLALALLYFFIDARIPGFFPRCPFNTFTRLFCPGCGSQRAISALVHGQFLQAVGFNVLMVASLPLIFYAAIAEVLSAFTNFHLKQQVFYSPLFAKVLLVLVLAFGISRNIPLYPFTLLAP